MSIDDTTWRLPVKLAMTSPTASWILLHDYAGSSSLTVGSGRFNVVLSPHSIILKDVVWCVFVLTKCWDGSDLREADITGSSLFRVGVTGGTNPLGWQPSHPD